MNYKLNNKFDEIGQLYLMVPELLESRSHSRGFLLRKVVSRVSIVDIEYGFKVFIFVKNMSNELISGLCSVNCLSLKDSLFSDSDWSRTYYKHNNNLLSYLDSTFYSRPGTGHDSDFHRITFTGKNLNMKVRQSFWSKWSITDNNSDDGIMAVVSSCEEKSMVIMFEDAYSLQSSRREKWRCIHSNSFFGDIESGVEIEKCGFVLMLPYSVKKCWPMMEDFNNV